MAGNGRGINLSARKQRAVTALLLSSSLTEAARVARVGERSIRRWLASDADFQGALAAAEQEAVDHAARRLAGCTAAALDALEGVIRNDGASAGVRVRACEVVLSCLMKLRAAQGVEARLAALEGVLNGTKDY